MRSPLTSMQLYIAAVVLTASIVTVGGLISADRPTTERAGLALGCLVCMTVASLCPLPWAAKTKLYLDTCVIVASALLLEPGVAMAVVALGTIIAHAIRRQDWDQTAFNASQATLETALAGLILASGNWRVDAMHFNSRTAVLMVPLAGAAIYVLNTLSVATIVGLQTEAHPLQVWRSGLVPTDWREPMAHLSQVGIGLLVAHAADARGWALPLLMLPAIAVHRSLTQHVKLRERVEAALRRSEANLAEAQRIARLGSWDWDLETDALQWSDEAYRVFGYPPGEIAPFRETYLAVVHPADRAAVEQAVREALLGRPLGIDHRIVRLDGVERIVHSQAEIVFDDNRRPHLIGTVQDITERKLLEEQLLHQAFHDPLTDLPNRALFADRLEHALARASQRQESVAVLFLDLDRFKTINDSLGHAAGDQVLVAVARRLQTCARPIDTVARFGGDEFAMLVEDLADAREATDLARCITKALEAPFELNQHELFVNTSIGIAFSGPDHRSPADLLRDADLALYRAKDKGKSRYEVFEREMGAGTVERLELEAALRRAVERGEFRLYYQPNVELATGRIVGVEALVRWQRPDHGLVAPLDYIPLAEETGLIVPIGRWVIAEACRQGRIWQDAYPAAPPIVSVNLSARQFSHPDLVSEVSRILDESGFEARNLGFEITESALMGDAEAQGVLLPQLKSLGIRLAIDDFGTGYSSLSYLKRFPVDTLKIDRSFVTGLGHDLEDTSIVHAVIDLARALGLQVIAEGVENVGQLDQLRAYGCQLGQGHYFSKALLPVAVDGLLAMGTFAIGSGARPVEAVGLRR